MTYPNLFPLIPELFLSAMIIVLLLVDAFSTASARGLNFVIAIVAILVVI